MARLSTTSELYPPADGDLDRVISALFVVAAAIVLLCVDVLVRYIDDAKHFDPRVHIFFASRLFLRMHATFLILLNGSYDTQLEKMCGFRQLS